MQENTVVGSHMKMHSRYVQAHLKRLFRTKDYKSNKRGLTPYSGKFMSDRRRVKTSANSPETS